MRLFERPAFFCFSLLLAPFLAVPAYANVQATVTVSRTSDGLVMHNGDETLHLSVCGPDVLHIVAGPGDPKAASPVNPWILHPCETGEFQFNQTAEEATLRTAHVAVSIKLSSGQLFFKDSAGQTLLFESDRRTRLYVPDVINGEKVYHVSDRFQPGPYEGFYGLGQHQSGVFNYRGSVVEMAQANTDIAVPLLMSSNGYGLLWNTASRSWFDNRYPNELKMSTEAADAIDYYFLYGPEMPQVIHHYDELTGHAPMFAKWAYGFFQSKDYYHSAKDLLDVVQRYRTEHVPLDVIVQDWFWWKSQGDPEYLEEYLKPYPDVPGALKKLHDEHIHAMISIWPLTDPKSDLYKELKERNLLIPGTTDYDATNPEARELYWKHLAGKIFAQGWDAFWLDSSEPECCNGYSDATLSDRQLFIGNGARYANIFPLLHSGNIYEHWRKTTDQKRVFILTRSAFAGQQRNAAMVWSGDVLGTFSSFRRQIPAGLNFELSGMPYWTTDIAGYGWPYERDTHDPSYQELYTRWYEFGVFSPVFRTHGHRSNNTNEIFSYDSQTPTLIRYDNLRYRLLPYIYSLAWRVTSEDYTPMRPLVMDWRTNEKVHDIGDEFLFGPSLLVNPVIDQGAVSRSVYLPPAARWYDFWTGAELKGDQRIQAEAPLDRIPVYVKGGSILPLGPQVEYTGQSPDAPLELRIYRGADADFNLYEDEGDSYRYEKGAHSIIPIHWSESDGTLQIGDRQGEYPGMPAARTFRVILVNGKNGSGQEVAAKWDKEIHYDGKALKVSLQ
ncbi:TIM-barrel domain-containing protein [Silvibacterium acidisoli]|uniref:TIM-barrel domain-containing protein n=1 Tax=Acidobacteriaceae bacterium ZG23-2 TaxID=2883246 RepID=UPI00406D147F